MNKDQENQKHILINKYLEIILEINNEINLTRISTIEQGKILHIEDSISVFKYFNEAPNGLYGDMGSGGGFPGVPLGILSERNTILIDSVKKKMSAVSTILNKLEITNISTNNNRIEDIAKTSPNSFAILTARALSSLPSIMELASPLLMMNGIFISLKANISNDELNAALKNQKLLGLKLIHDDSFYLSDEITYRRVLVFKKYKDPSIKLPRRVGLAQAKPFNFIKEK
jgi:16S rRNA (guanine527-N7)-methyltransferase